jgi:isopenicillin-N N-acyltransferase like protein
LDQIPHIRVKGNALERGRQYGTQARARVRRSVAAYFDVFAGLAGLQRPRVHEYARSFIPPIEELNPGYLDEMQGIAAGAGVDLMDVLAINVRTEIMFSARARAAAAQNRSLPGECTSFAVVPPPGSGEPVLVGQNWDWLPHCSETIVVLEAEQEAGPDFVTVVEAGLLAKFGLNSAGLGIATNALVTDDDRGEPGLPYHVLLRALHDCETVTAALAILQRGFRSSSANYLLAHADGVALDVEAAPGDFSRMYLTFPNSGFLFHTNHFFATLPQIRDVSIWAMPDSAVRLSRVLGAAQSAGFTGSGEQLQALLADHADYPNSVCCHPDERMIPLDRSATVASAIIDLRSRRMWLAAGFPCSTPYRELDYGGFLAKPPAVSPANQGMTASRQEVYSSE